MAGYPLILSSVVSKEKMLKWKNLCFIYLVITICNGRLVNVALNKPATQISTFNYNKASRGNDGIDGLLPSTNGCTHTRKINKDTLQPESLPWWEVDLLQDYFIYSVAITHVSLPSTKLAHDFSIEIYKNGSLSAEFCHYQVGYATYGETVLYMCKQIIKGRYVRITINGQPGVQEILILCEVRVFGTQSARITSSYIRMEAVEISSTPDMTYSVQGYGQCAMKCYVLPMCHIFSVISMPSYYHCNIFIRENIKLVGNSTRSPDTAVFSM